MDMYNFSRRVRVVAGFSRDKDISATLRVLLPQIVALHFVCANSPRYVSSPSLHCGEDGFHLFGSFSLSFFLSFFLCGGIQALINQSIYLSSLILYFLCAFMPSLSPTHIARCDMRVFSICIAVAVAVARAATLPELRQILGSIVSEQSVDASGPHGNVASTSGADTPHTTRITCHLSHTSYLHMMLYAQEREREAKKQ